MDLAAQDRWSQGQANLYLGMPTLPQPPGERL